MSKKISIIGCGWLGLPLAKQMVEDNWIVKGTTTSTEKIDVLTGAGISATVLKLEGSQLSVSDQSIFDCDIAYINIPPRRRIAQIETRYPQEIATLISALHKSTRVIFVSSTGVYPDNHQLQTEELEPVASKRSGLALVAAESLVRNRFDKWVILRLSGLAGPNREPGRWFSGKKDLPNGLNPVNMVHLDDCIALSKLIIQSDQVNQKVYNVCADRHPVKIDFYNAQCEKLGIEKPMFRQELGPHKVVKNDLVKKDMGYSFIYPDPLLF